MPSQITTSKKKIDGIEINSNRERERETIWEFLTDKRYTEEMPYTVQEKESEPIGSIV